MTWKPASLILATFAFTVPAHTQGNAPEPEGYRTDDYRAPVPTALAGARVLATEEAEAIWPSGAGAFIDVLPKPQLPAGTIWRENPRFNIPGSVWLPDTGYGKLAAATENYLRQGLSRATGGNNAKLLVIYCQADCWMSWNAAKRALSYGYTMWPGIPKDRRLAGPTRRWRRFAARAAQVKRRHFPANDSTSGRRPACMRATPSPAGSRGRGQIDAGQSQWVPRT